MRRAAQICSPVRLSDTEHREDVVVVCVVACKRRRTKNGRQEREADLTAVLWSQFSPNSIFRIASSSMRGTVVRTTFPTANMQDQPRKLAIAANSGADLSGRRHLERDA